MARRGLATNRRSWRITGKPEVIPLFPGMYGLPRDCKRNWDSRYGIQIKEKFQAYLLNEVTVDVNGKPLKPGAYGIAFFHSSTFIVTDLGSNNVLEVAGAKDAELKRPVPLQVVAATAAGSYRLYVGRDYVTFKRE